MSGETADLSHVDSVPDDYGRTSITSSEELAGTVRNCEDAGDVKPTFDVGLETESSQGSCGSSSPPPIFRTHPDGAFAKPEVMRYGDPLYCFLYCIAPQIGCK